EDPGMLAADLAVGSVAAITCYGCPAIILDLDTATTMVVVDKNACYRGGAIMPGVRLGLQALSSGTSLLPDISVSMPRRVIATNTVDAMRSGAVYATAAMIDGMIERMEEELGYSCRVIATGGLASVITPYCKKEIVCDENLLMKGLWALYEKNSR
ncbi:MAG: type III pantothenate kinase, partial [Eubacteriales bacterium]|nr:type III pantothenate kinase [Eubacteriales bacterium]